MSHFEQFINWLFQHPVIGFALITAVVSALRSILSPKAKKKAQSEEQAHRAPAPEDDLEARVRRNFEEMMRRRTAAAATPAPAAPPKPQPKPKPRVVDYDEMARPEPTSTEAARGRMVEGARVVRSVRRPPKTRTTGLPTGASVQGTLRTAGAARSAKRDRLRDIQKVVFEPSSLRRAIILREILDPAVALRD